ncbi:hypothetical protein Q73A0000_13885 [Kaistella flava (ex Peng et al. 2021)]|uniref:Uncharacterized protein n=1 Tax=Kaistella flava (ex Peng et al. 2021) TaxID=2038776 RepID=A0A7M2YDA6_9FLAO|nr:hypothetical protein [Kaistella flava (ex Peng et al. 2021)]QOW11373.1 hypothetical protein Q73A0000_13885 [Kaistella flava (ex Peng et al. 2021)]
MDIPFKSLKSFQENYTSHLNSFIEEFPNATEIDFLHQLKRMYSFEIKFDNTKRVFNDLIWIKTRSFDESFGITYEDDEISISMFALIVEDYLNYYMPLIGDPFSYNPYSPFVDDEDVFVKDYEGFDIKDDPIKRLFIISENVASHDISINSKSLREIYLLQETFHYKYFKFLYFDNGKIKADEHKFQNYGFAVTNILNELDRKIFDTSIKSDVQDEIITENDYSDTRQLERMILLEKLGIIKYIQSIQNDVNNEKHTAEILSALSGINSATIAKNLGVMLGAKKNDNDKNSPYKNPKNLQLANNKLYQFNIDLTKIIL